MNSRFSIFNILSPTVLLALVLGLFVYGSTVLDIDQSVRASGQIITRARTQVIQAADGGVLSELMVQEGQLVKAGQLLARLEKNRAQAGFEEVSAKIAGIKVGLIRARAEVLGRAPAYGAEFNAYPEFVAVQRSLYTQRLRSLNEEIDSLKDAMTTAKDELDMNAKLLETGDAGRLDVIRAQRQVAELQGKMSAARNKYLQEARLEAVKLEDDLAAQNQKQSGQKSVLEHTDLTAPVPGIVKYMKLTTLGGVLRQGDELMQISPEQDDMVLEVKVSPADVGAIKPGLPATVKLDAFDYSIFGTLSGQLTLISPDTLSETGPTGRSETFYRAQIKIDPNQQTNPRAKEILVKTGMTGSVDIRTGTRSVFEYLLKPIIKSFHGALSER